MTWQQVIPGVQVYRDSCNVYAVEGSTGSLIVDAGTGAWLDHVDQLSKPPVALLCTHHFRDHAAGALPASQRSIPVYVPQYEHDLFADCEEHFRQRKTYIIYDNQWDLNVPIESVPVADALCDYDTVDLGGLKVEIVPLPGATPTQIGLKVHVPAADRTVIFCGETIHSAGRLPRIAPLQYNYQDLAGAANVNHSVNVIKNHQPDALLPSMGDPILNGVDDALTQLQNNLRKLAELRPDLKPMFDQPFTAPLQKVTDHVYLDTQCNANTWYLISESGKAMVIDYGYRAGDVAWPTYPLAHRRRALLHGLTSLNTQFGIDRIDVALISHFHDDHVCGIPILKRLFDTQVWAAENFAFLHEHPEAHCFPCNWPQRGISSPNNIPTTLRKFFKRPTGCRPSLSRTGPWRTPS